jgi:hypothetical protein
MTKQEWIEHIDKNLFGLWNNNLSTTFFHGIYAGAKTSEITISVNGKTTDYKYTIDVKEVDGRVILDIIDEQNRIVTKYQIFNIFIFPQPIKLILHELNKNGTAIEKEIIMYKQ